MSPPWNEDELDVLAKLIKKYANSSRPVSEYASEALVLLSPNNNSNSISQKRTFGGIIKKLEEMKKFSEIVPDTSSWTYYKPQGVSRNEVLENTLENVSNNNEDGKIFTSEDLKTRICEELKSHGFENTICSVTNAINKNIVFKDKLKSLTVKEPNNRKRRPHSGSNLSDDESIFKTSATLKDIPNPRKSARIDTKKKVKHVEEFTEDKPKNIDNYDLWSAEIIWKLLREIVPYKNQFRRKIEGTEEKLEVYWDNEQDEALVLNILIFLSKANYKIEKFAELFLDMINEYILLVETSDYNCQPLISSEELSFSLEQLTKCSLNLAKGLKVRYTRNISDDDSARREIPGVIDYVGVKDVCIKFENGLKVHVEMKDLEEQIRSFYRVGDKVSCPFQDYEDPALFPAEVTKVNEDGTLDVIFTDENDMKNKASKVDVKLIQPLCSNKDKEWSSEETEIVKCALSSSLIESSKKYNKGAEKELIFTILSHLLDNLFYRRADEVKDKLLELKGPESKSKQGGSSSAATSVISSDSSSTPNETIHLKDIKKELDLSIRHDKIVANVIECITQLTNKVDIGRQSLELINDDEDADENVASKYIDDFDSTVDNIIAKLRQNGLNLDTNCIPKGRGLLEPDQIQENLETLLLGWNEFSKERGSLQKEIGKYEDLKKSNQEYYNKKYATISKIFEELKGKHLKV